MRSEAQGNPESPEAGRWRACRGGAYLRMTMVSSARFHESQRWVRVIWGLRFLLTRMLRYIHSRVCTPMGIQCRGGCNGKPGTGNTGPETQKMLCMLCWLPTSSCVAGFQTGPWPWSWGPLVQETKQNLQFSTWELEGQSWRCISTRV